MRGVYGIDCDGAGVRRRECARVGDSGCPVARASTPSAPQLALRPCGLPP